MNISFMPCCVCVRTSGWQSPEVRWAGECRAAMGFIDGNVILVQNCANSWLEGNPRLEVGAFGSDHKFLQSSLSSNIRLHIVQSSSQEL
jgi:hypothetical protein